jgi:asparagine synthase (glutamine-hydrolysing)
VNSRTTCYAAISELGAGHTLTWERGTGLRVARFWNPPAVIARGGRSIDEAAEELRSLLTRATDERMSPDGPTGVSLSGGWDSTAVFGAGQNALQHSPATTRALHPVSISYPEGDPGREDDLIAETTARWHAAGTWIDVDTIPMFDDAFATARNREEPWSHPYEQWNRALARTARGAGARALLDGVGGDSLFQVSAVFLSDLFKQGRWMELRRQWRIGGGGGTRAFLRAVVKPALPDGALRVLAAIRRTGPPSHYLVRTPSPWFRTAFLREHAVLEREQRDTPALPRSSRALAETHAYLLYPAFPRLMSRLFSFALGEGVELRSPLLDSRVVNFAVRRPWYERADGAETKILLRRSMRGLLPDRLLAPRPHRTGITSGYFNRCLQGAGRPVVERAMQDSLLASMGMIEPTALARAWEYYLRSGDDEVGVRVYFTIQTELWLREHQPASIVSGA